MKRRTLIVHALSTIGLVTANRLLAHNADVNPIQLSEAQWLEKLNTEQYDILRLGDTEPPGSSPLNREN